MIRSAQRPVVLAGSGTPAVRWQLWDAPATWPPLDLGRGGRALVVVPHPDDATVAIGGTMKLLAERGWSLHLVDVTDGEDSHPFTAVLDHEAMAVVRCAEQRRALERLTIGDVRVDRLRLPDGEVGACREALRDALRARLDHVDLCIAPWDGDGHPDHDAAGSAAADAARDAGVELWQYPVWLWHWAEPDDARVPWERARRIDVPLRVRAARAQAVQSFASQMRPLGPALGDVPLLPEASLQRFDRPYEVVFT